MNHNEEETMATMPRPGFRFFPTEEELASFYLHNKLLIASTPDHTNDNDNLSRNMDQIIPVLDIYHFNPWELPQNSGVMNKDDLEQWFFFIPRRKSEERGARPNRLTTAGYWKATGSPGLVFSSGNRTIGVKRSMMFYIGRAPNGTRTEWKMNEYRALVASGPALLTSSSTAPPAIDPSLIRQEFILCQVYKKSKCLWAFDWRPWAPITDDSLQGTSHASQLAAHLLGAGSSSSAAHALIISPANPAAETSGSSSRAQDHTCLDRAAEGASNIQEIGAEDYDSQECFWDWDIASMDFSGIE